MKKLSINWPGLRFAIRESAWAVVDSLIQVAYSINDWIESKRARPVVKKEIELDEHERMLIDEYDRMML